MKRLLLLRHAKAEPREGSVEDIPRALVDAGREDCEKLGSLLETLGLRPDLVLTSVASRAKETASLVVRELAKSPPVRVSLSLYADDARGYLRAASGAPEECSCLLVVGHNPAIEELASILAGRRVELRTCWLAELSLDVETWKGLLRKPRPRLERLLSPLGEQPLPRA